MNHKSVVVGVDGTAATARSVSWAAHQARRDGLPLRIVHAYELPLGFPTGVTQEESVLAAVRDQGRQWLAEAADLAAEVLPVVRIETALAAASAEAALLRESEEAAVVVLGNKGRNALTGLLVGSTSLALAGRTRCPVVLVRDADEERAGPVVVGVDGTEASEPAIAFAFAEASARGATLVALHAWSDTLFELALAGNNAPVDLDRYRRAGEESLAERLAGWQEKYPDVRIEREVVHGRPGHALRTSARNAQLLVVGRRGHGGFHDLVLGSTSQYVVHHATCPVAVVRGEASD